VYSETAAVFVYLNFDGVSFPNLVRGSML